MKVVRQRMIKPFLSASPMRKLALLLPVMGLLSSCNPTELTGSGTQGSVVTNDGSFDNKAYVYTDSPTILAKSEKYGPKNVNMDKFLDPYVKLITPNNLLTGNCSMSFYGFKASTDELNDPVDECIHSLKDDTSNVPVARKADRTYIFPANSPEFYQTNALYHLSEATKTFFEKLSFAYETIHSLSFTVPKSIPPYLMNSKFFWFKAMSSVDSKIFNKSFLTSYALCDLDNNAFFSPAGPALCFGGDKDIPNFHFIQDPSIIYHEFGHALVSIMMNMRNGTDFYTYHPLRSNLGSFGYDEAGSINEGIADYYSYVMTARESMGEYALRLAANQDRPISEASPEHIPGIAETPEGRLAYPQFLLYDPNFPDEAFEDIHYAGQITSHYLVALTKSLKKECNLLSEPDKGHKKATSYVMLVLAETLSELGDLNARGIDNFGVPLGGSYYFNNLDDSSSYLWAHVVNPVNYRRFFQVFAKNIYKYISGKLCDDFDKNKSEKLLDDYGLLLFKTYNDNGTSTKDDAATYQTALPYLPVQSLTPVSENNRRKSVLVSNQLIELAEKTDTEPDRVSFYIIDNSTDMANLLQDLLFKGFTVPITKDIAGTEYNNNNIRISPGEVVAIIPNLLNNSNSPMAGVQLLASDWDHVSVTDTNTGNFKPCVVDNETTVDQGAEAGGTCATTEKSYKRLLKDTSTGKFPTDAVAPVCFVQLEEGDSSRWVSQNEYRKKQGLSLLDKDCLGYSTTSTTDQDFSFNPHECLVRFLPGANDAFFSKIDPQKTYYETVIKQLENPTFNSGNIMIMEVNKWIPPGTKFRCRMRARFSNCSDCFNDGSHANDDYIDADYNGSKPFKVINFDFDIND